VYRLRDRSTDRLRFVVDIDKVLDIEFRLIEFEFVWLLPVLVSNLDRVIEFRRRSQK
jgi:hypothetical protein